ncbi:hypothetical protein KIW84_054509, partial [Lathyrus oleraceus]
ACSSLCQFSHNTLSSLNFSTIFLSQNLINEEKQQPFTFPMISSTLIFILAVCFTITTANTLGTGSTTAITSNTSTICGIVAGKPHKYIQCYQNGKLIPIFLPNVSFQSISGGRSFFCGLRSNGLSLHCWDTRTPTSFLRPKRLYHSEKVQLSDVAVGDDHVCARELHSGMVKCWRGYGGVEFPSPDESFRFRGVTCGYGFCCGILKVSNRVFCWGVNGKKGVENLIQKQFENLTMSTLVSGVSHVCGLTTLDGVLVCKGKNNNNDSGLCTILYFLMIGARKLVTAKIDNSVQPTSSESDDDDAYVDIAPSHNNGTTITTTALRSFSSKRHSSSRLRSGSSSKQLDRTESFTFWELVSASDNFSVENKIGAGSFGCVYKGRLLDGREVAIKRGDTTCAKKKKFQEKETSFDSEITLLSRLHHKHLVRLIGFCEENDERLLVYEYMSNGSLHDHLHDKSNVEKNSSIMNSWKMRIKVALDAARGIEYIHNYAVPLIIHRDIKSSNILLDSKWNARVSDFGLSLIWQETELELMSDTKAVGTVGYIDPEYYVSNVLTTKSDVYGLGVVML